MDKDVVSGLPESIPRHVRPVASSTARAAEKRREVKLRLR